MADLLLAAGADIDAVDEDGVSQTFTNASDYSDSF